MLWLDRLRGEARARGSSNVGRDAWNAANAELKAAATQRFLARVDRQPFGCWLWTGEVTQLGYGVFRADGVRTLAHRFMFELAYGQLGPTDLVLHSCDNRVCVNPMHIRAGTCQDNTDDMMRRGRHGASKITAAQAAEIRASSLGLRELATIHGISKTQVFNIRHRRHWR